MRLEHIKQALDNRRDATGLKATLNPAATANALEMVEARIRHRLPDQVRLFYSNYNGLTVDDPPFEILPVENLSVDDKSRIHFATADHVHRICFDCSHGNEAGQWDIIESATGNRITFTMSSFWSNKFWKWIDRRLAFWQGEV